MSARIAYKSTDIGEIPKDWEVVPAVEVCNGTTQHFLDGDWVLSKDMDENGDIRLVQLGNIGEGKFIDDSKRWISQEKLRELGCKLLRTGDILVSRMADPVARSCILPNLPYQSITAVDVAVIRPNAHVFDTNFVNNLFNSKIVRSQAYSFSAGATRPRISRSNLERIQLPKPPLGEQSKVASILLTIDAMIQKTDEIISKTQQLKKGLMQQLLTKGIGHTKFKKAEIGEIPEEWKVVRLGELVDVLNGRFFPSEHYTDNGIKLLRPGNLHEEGFIDWNQGNTRYLPVEYASSAKEWIVRGNEIVINLTAQSLEEEFLGRACITSEDEYCLLNQRIARFTPRNIDPVFLFWVMKSGVFRRFVDRLPGGTKIKHIYTRELLSFQLPYPPLAEQRRIAKVLLDISQKIAYEKDLLSRLHSLKKGLMQVLLTGRVRVKVN